MDEGVMGYLPKHIKVQNQKRTLRMIAHAALAGAVIVKVTSDANARPRYRYYVQYDDGRQSHFHDRRGQAAVQYLIWWFQKNDMWPRYK